MDAKCTHLNQIGKDVKPSTTAGCEDCLKPFEPGEDWRWCYIDEDYV